MNYIGSKFKLSSFLQINIESTLKACVKPHKNANFEWTFLNYNDERLLNLKQIRAIFEKYSRYSLESQKYQRFKSDSKRIQKQDSTTEYLYILRK